MSEEEEEEGREIAREGGTARPAASSVLLEVQNWRFGALKKKVHPDTRALKPTPTVKADR
jgi:hypothetical protein